jgi:glycolate oxidase iron-sulfur subunit
MATGRESSVARGHLARLRATIEADIPFDDDIRSSLFECLMCRACTAECPPAIETDRAVVAARAGYVEKRQSLTQKLIFRWALPNPPLLRTGARALDWAKRMGVTRLAGLLNALPWLDRGLAEGPRMMPAPGRFLRDRIARRDDTVNGQRRVTYFVGCALDYALPAAGEATLNVLEAAGISAVPASNVCCGLPPYSYGDIGSARALARKNVEALRESGDGAIVTECASCSSFLREYPSLFEADDPMRADAEAMAARVQDLSTFVPAVGVPEALRRIEAVVTYHDPCHLSRYQGITREPRELIQRIPGLEYRELPEADWCCGGAGSYSLSHHELSMEILGRKMENVRSTGAEVVVTPCPACILQLRYGAEKFGVPVEVIHLSEMLQRALPAERDGGGVAPP